MPKTYAQIQKQIDVLQHEAEKLRHKEVAGVIGRIKEAIAVYGLTAADLGFAPLPAKAPRTAASAGGRKATARKAAPAVRYRDDQNHVWGGRGPRPQWLRDALANGKTLQDFAV